MVLPAARRTGAGNRCRSMLTRDMAISPLLDQIPAQRRAAADGAGGWLADQFVIIAGLQAEAGPDDADIRGRQHLARSHVLHHIDRAAENGVAAFAGSAFVI